LAEPLPPRPCSVASSSRHGVIVRIANCPLCKGQFALCRSCDRGQLYCGASCSAQARRTSLQVIRRRYRRSEAGKAARRHQERRRRQRRRSGSPVQTVGDQGSPSRESPPIPDLPPAGLPGSVASTTHFVPPSRPFLRCCRCSKITHFALARSSWRARRLRSDVVAARR